VTTLTAASPERPGTSYYVPGVRLVKLSSTIQAGGEQGRELDRDVLADILSVEVTSVANGASTYKITLNNWYTSTASDNTGKNDDFATLAARESAGRGGPLWPRFKYNDLSLLSFGMRLRIDMRYMPEPVAAESIRRENSKNAWVPMISGPVTDMRFTFGAAEGARVEISGEDDLSALKDKVERRIIMDRLGEVNIVRQALSRASYPISNIAEPLVSYPSFATNDNQGLREAIQRGQSYLDLIQKLGERLDFEVFVAFRDLDDPASALEFHFEPCRARVLADGFKLDRERDLLAFTPTIKVVDQYSKVHVLGRHRDPLLAKPVDGEAQHTIVKDELHRDPSRDGELKSAGEVREEYFANRSNPHEVPNQSNMDPVRADWYAEAVIRRKAREFFTVEVTTLGRPRLRPGQHVEIRGMRPPFDGFYYATQVVTTYGVDGLRTRVTASRPGMELPPYKEAS
jgi:hypothetical protein